MSSAFLSGHWKGLFTAHSPRLRHWRRNLPVTECTVTLTQSILFQQGSRMQSSFVKLVSVSIYGCFNWLLLANMGGGVRIICTLAFKSFVRARGASLLHFFYWLQWVRWGGTWLFYFPGTLFMAEDSVWELRGTVSCWVRQVLTKQRYLFT